MRHLALLFLVACGGPSTPPAPPAPALTGLPEAGSPEPVAADLAPFPYTTDQIRAACPVGRQIPFRVEMPGKPTIVHVIRFIAVDDKGADIEARNLDEKGNPLGDAEKEHATWEDLHQHAAFPKSATTVEDGIADTPAGKFPSRVYTVKKDDEVSKFYFAVDRPGPPVLFYSEKNGQRIRTSTLLANVPVVTIACKTDDDCWMEGGKPVARPKELRGKKYRPCKDGEQAPVCKESVCAIASYKC